MSAENRSADYGIFRACFPRLKLTEELFIELSGYDSGRVFRADGGFAVVCGDRITLLAVHPQKQGRKIGSALLEQCERHICASFDAARLGGEISPGATAESAEFFRNSGYTLGEEFCEMRLDLTDMKKPPIPEDITFAPYTGDIERLRAAVASVDEEWVQYFTEDGSFFCGMRGDKIASFCITDESCRCLISDGTANVGNIGCVGTVPSERKKGAGLAMVYLAGKMLAEMGCGAAFIHYTALDGWYGKLGAETVLKFRLGEKQLKQLK